MTLSVVAIPKPSLVAPPADIAAHWDLDLLEVAERLPLGSARNVVARAAEVVIRIEETSVESIRWEHDLLSFLSASVPEVIAPITAQNGTTFLELDRRIASVYPFVEGAPLESDDPAARVDLAVLLARTHQRALDWPVRTQRPDRRSFRDLDWERNLWWDASIVKMPPALERGYASVVSWVAEAPQLLTCAVHGDFHARNVLTRKGRIVGVFDWEYARLDWPAAEVSALVWLSGDEVDIAATERIVAAYAEAGGPAETTFVRPLLRLRCVAAALYSLTRAARGESWNPASVDGQLRTLERLV
jgi:Ser/Thr protein kinase RdoA (MazF antagonist)